MLIFWEFLQTILCECILYFYIGDFGDEGRNSRGGNRPPPGLKGREIGMWYAKRSKEKGKQKEFGQVKDVARLFHNQF